ncbi:OmpA family protein [Lutibacter sp.]|uniref:OmpA family protein n=1 Tax=Lutibacter sp. TaxID=1925666 RepID=UPI0025C25B1F|nr:OmpA family protein [Lutibacter sp.]MCF6180560.1 OmpA family protein [Lutibacter sp.]
MKTNILPKRILILALLFLFIIPIKAQDKDNPWLISFGVNFVDFYPTNIQGMTSESGVPTKWYDQFFNLNNHYNYVIAPTKLSLGRYINESFSGELAVSVNKIDKVGSIKLAESVSYFAIDANLIYNINKIIGETGWFEPYAVAGSGFNAKGNNIANSIQFKNYASFNSGLGAKVWLYKNLGVKVQSVYKHFFNNGSYPHFQHSISIMYKFGGYDEDDDGIYDKNDKCPEVFGLKEFNGCPDTDEDGISDAEDKCPKVYGLKALSGCPDTDGDGVTDKLDKCLYAKGSLKNNGCPDTDNDGIIDLRDACPKIAGPLSNRGCPEPDTDGDGVIDKLDHCKYEIGTKTNNGCPDIKKDLEAKLTKITSNILFISGTDKFSSKYDKQLNEVSELMKKHKDLKFQIQGFTDNVGSKEYNKILSLKRVNRILGYLISTGVNQLNLRVKGFGEKKPIAPNNTAEGRAKNRRVEIKIVN